jgi:ATP-dependent helicase YprA (DUF1998 family)
VSADVLASIPRFQREVPEDERTTGEPAISAADAQSRRDSAKAHLALEKETDPQLTLRTYREIAGFDSKDNLPTFLEEERRYLWRREVELLFSEVCTYLGVLPKVLRADAEGKRNEHYKDEI